jgi:hypothetical protein
MNEKKFFGDVDSALRNDNGYFEKHNFNERRQQLLKEILTP